MCLSWNFFQAGYTGKRLIPQGKGLSYSKVKSQILKKEIKNQNLGVKWMNVHKAVKETSETVGKEKDSWVNL